MITVYGASDDCIEVEGDIREEFSYQKRGYGQPTGELLAFSDGTILRIEFTDAGVWRISPVARGAGRLDIVQASEGDEGDYSDVANLDGAVWVVQGIGYATARG